MPMTLRAPGLELVLGPGSESYPLKKGFEFLFGCFLAVDCVACNSSCIGFLGLVRSCYNFLFPSMAYSAWIDWRLESRAMLGGALLVSI